jgi:uroporphyrinogen-III decarboxylase
MTLRLAADNTRLPTHLIAFSDDSDIGFHCVTCTADLIGVSIAFGLFGKGPYSDDQIVEAEAAFRELTEKSRVEFEDGWITMDTGIADIVAFFTAKLKEAADEVRWADTERFSELQRRQAIQRAYTTLCTALSSALGPQGGAEIRALVTAPGSRPA